jgi:hypothetical protein
MQPERGPRLLISASDPAAADAVRPIALAAGRHGIAHQLVAGEPAYGRLRAAELEVELFACRRVMAACDGRAPALLAAASDLIVRHRPDAIVVGLSGPDAGLDEALVMAADGHVPCYAVQDYWGDVNTVLPARPSAFLVVDDYAAELTRRRSNSDVHVVGPLRYADYGRLQPEGLRKQARARLRVADGQKLIGIFTQPLWHIEGYAAQWDALIGCLAEGAASAISYVRRHPRDQAAHAGGLFPSLDAARVPYVDASGLTIEEALCACDIVCSASSSVATDLCYLQRRAGQPLGSALFLLFAPALRRHFQEECALAVHPLVAAGLALEVEHQSLLADRLAQALDENLRRRTWLGCRRLPDAEGAAERVIDRLLHDWAKRAQ